MTIKVTVNYDYTQKELLGEKDVFEIPAGTTLSGLLRKIDIMIIDAGKSRGIDTTRKTTLAEGNLNACVVFVNGSAPTGMLEQELYEGDTIEFVYGFCGG
ncbi:MAG: MoaD/ThiS family protein [Candidatus Methanoperedens sp.]|nr:MoaD/ThiS family protein [Candidatus Methanoperedens sp.]